MKKRIVSIVLLGMYFFGGFGMAFAADADFVGPPTEQQKMLDDQWSEDDEKNATSSSPAS